MANYNRTAAVNYAKKWAYSRNPKYYNFDPIGGDCTNFVSQCIYAGAKVMNYSKNGWYYINLNNRAPAWTGVVFLYRFLVNNTGAGPYGKLCQINELLPADIIQLYRSGKWSHTLFVSKIIQNPLQIFVATHTYDSFNNPLSRYWYDDIRFINIEGVKK